MLAQFSLLERNDVRTLDCNAYFRKQEMQYWWTVNMAELARLQKDIASRLQSPASSGRIVTFAASAHWNTRLPGVAVPVVDLLVEDSGRLWGLAFAVAFPQALTAASRSDWARVLSDLTGEGRAEPPRPRVGADMIRAHVERLALAVPSLTLNAVSVALQQLCQQYGALANTPELNAAAVELVRERVGALRLAVDAALGAPG